MSKFWALVDSSGGDATCWPWTGTRNEKGYGRYIFGHQKEVRAHRHAFVCVKGALPRGAMVLHTCDNPPCCNPAHLYAGTAKQNSADMVSRCRVDGGGSAAECNPRAKLTCEDASAIRAAIRAGATNTALARVYQVHHSTVSAIRRGRSWNYLAAT